jgi:hypothetical protein
MNNHVIHLLPLILEKIVRTAGDSMNQRRRQIGLAKVSLSMTLNIFRLSAGRIAQIKPSQWSSLVLAVTLVLKGYSNRE